MTFKDWLGVWCNEESVARSHPAEGPWRCSRVSVVPHRLREEIMCSPSLLQGWNYYREVYILHC